MPVMPSILSVLPFPSTLLRRYLNAPVITYTLSRSTNLASLAVSLIYAHAIRFIVIEMNLSGGKLTGH